MADLTPLSFDPAQVEDMGDGFKVIPPNTYPVVIVESDVKDTSTGGKMLVLKYQIIEGQYTGEYLTDRLNIQNKSEKAQAIGLSQLKHICDAISHKGLLKDSSVLHGKPFSVKVIIEQFANRDGKMLDSNRIDKRMARQALGQAVAPPPADNGTAPKRQAW